MNSSGLFGKIFRTLMLLVAAAALTACLDSSSGSDSGGSNDSSAGGGSVGGAIDLRDYLVPTSNQVRTFEEYYVSDNQAYLEDTFTESWQVSGGSVIVTSDYDEDGESCTVISSSNQLGWNCGDGEVFNFPRFVNPGSMNIDSFGNQFVVFGPFNNRQINIPGTTISRTDSDVIIMVWREDWDGEWDYGVGYYSTGIGKLAWFDYWDCPANLPLEPDYDYAQQCFGETYIDILLP